MKTELIYYTVTEAAKILDIHERNVKELVRQEQLATVTIDGKMKITKQSMDELLPGFKNDPNPDQEVKKQRHPVKKDMQEKERHKLMRSKARKVY